MSFFDKLRTSAVSAAAAAKSASETAVKQGKTLASIGRVKVSIATEEDKAKKAYTELGKLYYRDYVAEAEANMEEYQPILSKIEEAKKQIALLNEELEALKAEDSAEEPAPAEEPVVYADFDDFVEETEDDIEVEVYVVEEEPAAEQEIVVVDEVPFVEEAPVVEEAPAEEPQVGTLYIDVTDQE